MVRRSSTMVDVYIFRIVAIILQRALNSVCEWDQYFCFQLQTSSGHIGNIHGDAASTVCVLHDDIPRASREFSNQLSELQDRDWGI